MRLSVVIPCFNAAATIEAQLEALLAQNCPELDEIIVSDNGSSDDSVQRVRRYSSRFPEVRVIEAIGGTGPGYARNEGAKHARGDALAFCDADDEVGPGWAGAMASALDSWDFVAGRLDHDRLNEPWVIAVRGRPQSSGLMHYAEGPWWPYAFGGTMGVRKSVHLASGGFDEGLFATAAEDCDYCWRLQLGGHELHFVPEAVTYYRHRADLGSIYRQARDYGRAQVALYGMYLDRGLPRVRRPWWKLLRLNLALVKTVLTARTRPTRAVAVWSIGQRVGRLRGSIENRILFP